MVARTCAASDAFLKEVVMSFIFQHAFEVLENMNEARFNE